MFYKKKNLTGDKSKEACLALLQKSSIKFVLLFVTKYTFFPKFCNAANVSKAPSIGLVTFLTTPNRDIANYTLLRVFSTFLYREFCTEKYIIILLFRDIYFYNIYIYIFMYIYVKKKIYSVDFKIYICIYNLYFRNEVSNLCN